MSAHVQLVSQARGRVSCGCHVTPSIVLAVYRVAIAYWSSTESLQTSFDGPQWGDIGVRPRWWRVALRELSLSIHPVTKQL